MPHSASRVLHLGQIPSDATEADVISLGLPFGTVTNLLMLKGKNQVCNFQCFNCKSKAQNVAQVMTLLVLPLDDMIARMSKYLINSSRLSYFQM